MRTKNKPHYRVAHLPVWIFVFFIAPGPLTFDLFAHGPDRRMLLWLAAVVAGTAIAGLFGRLPGTERTPYILRYDEDGPNPLHRRICYTFAWSEIIAYVLLNAAGLIDALANGVWRMRTIYGAGYFPIVAVCALFGVLGWLPRAGKSVQGERYERRWFYGSVWAVTIAQPLLWLMWGVLPETRLFDVVKLTVFLGVLALVGNLARRGRLPRTRPILPGQTITAD